METSDEETLTTQSETTDSETDSESETTSSETESESDITPEPDSIKPLAPIKIINQETFEVFFTDQKLKEQANEILQDIDPDAVKNISVILFLLPIDVLKKIFFDYLINTKSTDEQEIYRNYKNLSLSCKLFSKLGKVIMQQIVLISDKEVEDSTNKIPSRPKIHFAAFTNKALWLIHKKDALENSEDSIESEKVIYFKDVQSNTLCSLTPIELATEKNNYAVAKVLLSLGVKIEPRKYYMTGESDGTWTGPLHKACENLNLKMVELLIEHGANVNALDPDKKSPISKVLQKFWYSSFEHQWTILRVISDLEIEDKLVKILDILVKNGAKFKYRHIKGILYIIDDRPKFTKIKALFEKNVNYFKRLGIKLII